MGGKRVTKAIGRRVLAELPPRFTTEQLQELCAAEGVSYDTLSRRIQQWGWVREDGVKHSGKRGRPRPRYVKTR
jgi:hypothetical protein